MFTSLIRVLKASSLLLGLVPASVLAVEGTTNMTSAASMGASNVWLTFGLNRVERLQGSFLDNPIWEYLATIIFIGLALYAAKVINYLIQFKLRKIVGKTTTKIDDLMLELSHGPVKVIAFVILLHVGLRIFVWPEWMKAYISDGLKIVIAGSVTYLLLKLVDLGMQLWHKRIQASGEVVLDMHLFPVIRKTAKGFILIVAILVTSQNLGMNVTGLLASLSIGGLAVGLAAQDTLSNLFGAVALFVDKPFRIGDCIQFDKIDGCVEAIGLRSTRLRNQEGHLVVIPNRTMANASLTNVSKRPTIKTAMNIGLTYDTPVEGIQRAMKIIEEVYRPHPKTADLIVSFDKFDTSSLNIQVVHWWNSTDYKDYLANFQLLNLELKRRFDSQGIHFALPTQTVYLKKEGRRGCSAALICGLTH